MASCWPTTTSQRRCTAGWWRSSPGGWRSEAQVAAAPGHRCPAACRPTQPCTCSLSIIWRQVQCRACQCADQQGDRHIVSATDLLPYLAPYPTTCLSPSCVCDAARARVLLCQRMHGAQSLCALCRRCETSHSLLYTPLTWFFDGASLTPFCSPTLAGLFNVPRVLDLAVPCTRMSIQPPCQSPAQHSSPALPHHRAACRCSLPRPAVIRNAGV